MKKKTKLIILFIIAALWMARIQAGENAVSSPPEQERSAVSPAAFQPDGNTASPVSGSIDVLLEKPLLINHGTENAALIVTPCAKTYFIAPDLSNIDNLRQFYLEEEAAEKLAKNGFVVYGDAGREFFEIYESNRYSLTPSFVTVDSLMHTYHLYFSHLLKRTEKEYLSDMLTHLSHSMLENNIAQYERLTGSEWETAARRNVAFFTVGTKLLDENTAINDYVKTTVQHELDCINRAESIEISEITESYEDYSQYLPRGYYEGDRQLEQYFKAMMWYGRIHFAQKEEELDKSALLITQALSSDSESAGLWQAIYATTSFFAGASDDMGPCEYASAIREIYGKEASIDDFIGNEEAFSRFHNLTASLSVPRISSIPFADGDGSIIPGFRFMGQRFTIDAAVMQQLIYSNVTANEAGLNRMLPDVLDVPAALGSDMALCILDENGTTGYNGYMEHMTRLRQNLSSENDALWSASLYANWLNTLRPLLTEKGEGYPLFMQNEEWTKKALECFAGSFTELKRVGYGIPGVLQKKIPIYLL